MSAGVPGSVAVMRRVSPGASVPIALRAFSTGSGPFRPVASSVVFVVATPVFRFGSSEAAMNRVIGKIHVRPH